MTTMPLRAAMCAPSESRATERIRYFPVFSRRQIKRRFGDKSAVAQPFKLLAAGDELSVGVKDDGSHGYIVEVPSGGVVELPLCTSRPLEVAESLLNPATTKKLALI
jgi:hypothetical protein